MDDYPVARRVATIASAKPFPLLYDFYRKSGYEARRHLPGVLDFTFGDPHDPPAAAYVESLQEATIPRNEIWFAYNMGDPTALAAATASLRTHLGIPFELADLRLTSGGFAAICTALKIVGDPGDEVIYSLPPWFLYEPLVLEAGLVPVKVSIDRETFDLDLDAIASAITPRTRIVIVNTPNNPTGRIYPVETLQRLADLLEDASRRNGRRIYLISDEPYNRIIFDGLKFHSPREFYPHAFLASSYGKTLLSPGQRIGYLAIPPTMPNREANRDAIDTVQISAGWLFPKSPLPDDQAFVDLLSAEDVLVLAGRMFETPGFFRISLTATMETIEASLPRFAAAFAKAALQPVAG